MQVWQQRWGQVELSGRGRDAGCMALPAWRHSHWPLLPPRRWCNKSSRQQHQVASGCHITWLAAGAQAVVRGAGLVLLLRRRPSCQRTWPGVGTLLGSADSARPTADQAERNQEPGRLAGSITAHRRLLRRRRVVGRCRDHPAAMPVAPCRARWRGRNASVRPCRAPEPSGSAWQARSAAFRRVGSGCAGQGTQAAVVKRRCLRGG